MIGVFGKMLFILLIMGIILAYGAINSVVELIPFMAYLLLYLGVIIFGFVLSGVDSEKTDSKSKEEGYLVVIVYLVISVFFPDFIFEMLGILMNDVYSARFIGLMSTVVLLLIFFIIRRAAKQILKRKIITGTFIVVIFSFFLIFLNLGYKTYSQQVAARARKVEEYMVEKNTPLLVEISVAGNQKSTLFGDFFVTKDKFKYYYMGAPITHHFAFKRMPADSKLCVTGRDLYEKGDYIEVYCEKNGLAGYIKEEKLTCIVDYKYITNKDAPIYDTYEKEVNVIPAEGGEGGKTKELFVNSNHVIATIPEGTEILLSDGPKVPFGYECIETLEGRIGYIKDEDFDVIPISRN